MFQELELGHGEDDEDGGEAPVELSQAERESNNQHKQYLNEETKLECFIPLTWWGPGELQWHIHRHWTLQHSAGLWSGQQLGPCHARYLPRSKTLLFCVIMRLLRWCIGLTSTFLFYGVTPFLYFFKFVAVSRLSRQKAHVLYWKVICLEKTVTVSYSMAVKFSQHYRSFD